MSTEFDVALIALRQVLARHKATIMCRHGGRSYGTGLRRFRIVATLEGLAGTVELSPEMTSDFGRRLIPDDIKQCLLMEDRHEFARDFLCDLLDMMTLFDCDISFEIDESFNPVVAGLIIGNNAEWPLKGRDISVTNIDAYLHREARDDGTN